MSHGNLVEKLNLYLNSDEDFNRIYYFTNSQFVAATNLPAHNFEHARRDTINAIIIGEAEKADMDIVLPAAIMHDIGFLYGATGRTHGAIGAEKLPEYLAAGGIDLPSEKLAKIAACIRTHKGSMHGENPETIEAKVVSDADMLEKFGVMGVYQSIRSFTEFNLGIAEIITRFHNKSDLTFQTATGKRMAEPIKDYPSRFIADLEAAYETYGMEA